MRSLRRDFNYLAGTVVALTGEKLNKQLTENFLHEAQLDINRGVRGFIKRLYNRNMTLGAIGTEGH